MPSRALARPVRPAPEGAADVVLRRVNAAPLRKRARPRVLASVPPAEWPGTWRRRLAVNADKANRHLLSDLQSCPWIGWRALGDRRAEDFQSNSCVIGDLDRQPNGNVACGRT